MSDLAWLQQTGWLQSIHEAADCQIFLLGICGGYQMLGQRVVDPNHLESAADGRVGIGLFSYQTLITKDKRTVRMEGTLCGPYQGILVKGYEIHMGETSREAADQCFAVMHAQPMNDGNGGWTTERVDGVLSAEGTIIGTYLHGILHNDDFRTAWLNQIRRAKGLPEQPVQVQLETVRSHAYNRLATVVRSHLNMDRLYQILNEDACSEA